MADKIKTTNPYSGESTMLTQTEYNMYSNIKHAEFLGEYKEMQTMLDKFSRLNPKAYMVLLDLIYLSTWALARPGSGGPNVLILGAVCRLNMDNQF